MTKRDIEPRRGSRIFIKISNSYLYTIEKLALKGRFAIDNVIQAINELHTIVQEWVGSLLALIASLLTIPYSFVISPNEHPILVVRIFLDIVRLTIGLPLFVFV